MKILIEEEYGYAYYLWSPPDVFQTVGDIEDWFTPPTSCLQRFSAAVSGLGSLRELSLDEFYNAVEAGDADARIHWHEPEDSFVDAIPQG